MKNTLMQDLVKELFKVESLESYPKYTILAGEDKILIQTSKDRFKSLGIQNMTPEGIFCNDLETFIKWEQFS